jgi:hypothetical protein
LAADAADGACRFLPQKNPIKNIIAIPKKTPTPMAALATILGPEDCVSANPDRGPELLWLAPIVIICVVYVAIANVVGVATAKLVGLAVFGFDILCTVSIFCYQMKASRGKLA